MTFEMSLTAYAISHDLRRSRASLHTILTCGLQNRRALANAKEDQTTTTFFTRRRNSSESISVVLVTPFQLLGKQALRTATSSLHVSRTSPPRRQMPR